MLASLAGSSADADRFRAQFWPHTAAFFTGDPGRFPALFHAPELQSLRSLLTIGAQTELWWDDNGIRAAAVEPLGAARLYKRGGMTLRFLAVQNHIQAIRDVLAALNTELATPVANGFANVYVSPAGAKTAMHFDAAEVFVVQIAGKKHWSVAPNLSVACPAWGWAGGTPDAEEEAQMIAPLPARMPVDAGRFTLSPGDVLFLPRGWWHEATTSEEAISVSVALPCLTRLDVALELIKQAAITDPEWRRPAVNVTDQGAALALDESMRSLGQRLVDHGIDL